MPLNGHGCLGGPPGRGSSRQLPRPAVRDRRSARGLRAAHPDRGGLGGPRPGQGDDRAQGRGEERAVAGGEVCARGEVVAVRVSGVKPEHRGVVPCWRRSRNGPNGGSRGWRPGALPAKRLKQTRTSRKKTEEAAAAEKTGTTAATKAARSPRSTRTAKAAAAKAADTKAAAPKTAAPKAAAKVDGARAKLQRAKLRRLLLPRPPTDAIEQAVVELTVDGAVQMVGGAEKLDKAEEIRRAGEARWPPAPPIWPRPRTPPCSPSGSPH